MDCEGVAQVRSMRTIGTHGVLTGHPGGTRQYSRTDLRDVVRLDREEDAAQRLLVAVREDLDAAHDLRRRCVHIYIYMCVCIYIYVYIYI